MTAALSFVIGEEVRDNVIIWISGETEVGLV
jgi:hypothetical protein